MDDSPHHHLYSHLLDTMVAHAIELHEPREAVSALTGLVALTLLRHVEVSKEDLLSLVGAAYDSASEVLAEETD